MSDNKVLDFGQYKRANKDKIIGNTETLVNSEAWPVVNGMSVPKQVISLFRAMGIHSALELFSNHEWMVVYQHILNQNIPIKLDYDFNMVDYWYSLEYQYELEGYTIAKGIGLITVKTPNSCCFSYPINWVADVSYIHGWIRARNEVSERAYLKALVDSIRYSISLSKPAEEIFYESLEWAKTVPFGNEAKSDPTIFHVKFKQNWEILLYAKHDIPFFNISDVPKDLLVMVNLVREMAGCDYHDSQFEMLQSLSGVLKDYYGIMVRGTVDNPSIYLTTNDVSYPLSKTLFGKGDWLNEAESEFVKNKESFSNA